MQSGRLMPWAAALVAAGLVATLWGCGGGATPAAGPSAESAASDPTPAQTAAVSPADANRNPLPMPPGQRRGLDLVMLSHWHPDSVQRLLDVFKDSSGHYTRGPAALEISCAPFDRRRVGHEWDNLKRVTSALVGAGKSLTVCVYGDDRSWTTPSAGWAPPLFEFARDFVKPSRKAWPNLTFVYCPWRNDPFTDASFKSRQETLLWYMAYWVRRGDLPADVVWRIKIRRNGAINHAIEPDSRLPGVETEHSGRITSSGDVYTNRGVFVYDRHTHEMFMRQPINGEYSFETFLERIANHTHTVLLHRPGYSCAPLYYKYWWGNYHRYWEEQEFVGNGTWNDFDDVEQGLVKEFFGVS